MEKQKNSRSEDNTAKNSKGNAVSKASSTSDTSKAKKSTTRKSDDKPNSGKTK